MEIKQVIISQKESSQKYIFNNKINLVTSTQLSDELLKGVNNLADTQYVLESSGGISIADVFQIKINVAETGVLFVNFPKEALSEEDKLKLLEEIGSLKDNVEPTLESQKSKIARAIGIVAKYNPIYVCYHNRGNFLFTKSMFEEITKDIEIDFPILVLLASLNFVEQAPQNKKKKFVHNKPQKVQKEPRNVGNFAEKFKLFKSLDYVFFGVFSMFISFGLILSIFEVKNGEGIAVFLFILTFIFIATLYYATFRASRENENYSYHLDTMWVPATYIILGIALGTVIAWLVSSNVITLKEDVEISYPLLYGLCVPGTLLIAIAGLYSPILIEKIIKKNKK